MTVKLLILLAVLGTVLALPKSYSIPGDRIIGGNEADISDYPWTLGLQLYNQHYCGAALIAPEWILTTANCVDHGIIQGLSVRAGSTSRSTGGETIDISEIIIHPEYDQDITDYDFAVGRLVSAVTTPDARPIDLPEAEQPVEAGDIAEISGWGITENDGRPPEVLHAANVSVLSQEECERDYGERVTRSMFCAGDGRVDACQGDSGGPVVINNRLAGLISWGTRICASGYPGVYADVGKVVEWIQDVINGGPTPTPEPETSTGPTPSPEPEPSSEPTSSPEPEPSSEPTSSPEPEPSSEPTPTPEPEPTPSPEPETSPEPTPSPEPTSSAEPTPSPEPEPTSEPEPSSEPSPEPTPEPSPEPTPEPSPEPTSEPSPESTPEPTPEPSSEPSPEPTPEI